MRKIKRVSIFGKYGILSKIAFTFQLYKPVISFKTWDIQPIINVEISNNVIDKLKKEINYV